MQTPFSDVQQVRSALVITAHPDDVDFLASGTVAGWTASGIDTSYCVVTDGDAGGFDAEVARADIPGIRRAEQLAAARVVGVTDVEFLGRPDGSVTADRALRQDLCRTIRRVRPDRVVMHSPEINWPWLPDYHPDHRATGEASLRAVYPDSRNPFAHAELLEVDGLQPWSVDEIWMVGSPSANHWVDVTDRFDQKMAALRAHESQTAHLTDVAELIRSRLAQQAAEAGLAAGRLAEAFQVVSTR